MNIEKNILELSNQRDEILLKREESYNEDTGKYNYNDSEIDNIAELILNKINEHRDTLQVDFIIEQLTKLGQAPNVLYDDDGRFAVISDGFQTLVLGDEADDVEFQFNVEAKYFKKTIREALYFYLDFEY